MVALVKDDAAQARGLDVGLGPPRRSRAVESGLGEDEGVVGDDELRRA